ncbi:LysR substrate-binding domain-containing protein [Yoonia sp. MH D7]
MRYSLVQIRSIVEVARCGFHVSRAAKKLNTSQSVVSKHLKSFEDAFTAKIFERTGKRLTGLTAEGQKIIVHAERILRDHESIETIGHEAGIAERESLTLATTPTLARYLLADTVKKFTQMHPRVQLQVQVEETDKAIESLRHGASDFAIVPIGKTTFPDLTVKHLTDWTRLLIGLPDCTLFTDDALTLEAIAAEPIIAFETPTISLRDTFEERGIKINTAITTSNPGVMKAYAALGLGVAIVATPTFDPLRDLPLVSRDVSGIFPSVRIGVFQKADCYHAALQTKFIEVLETSFPKPEIA